MQDCYTVRVWHAFTDAFLKYDHTWVHQFLSLRHASRWRMQAAMPISISDEKIHHVLVRVHNYISILRVYWS